jgi:outer membrane lipoprotein-sorting protein
LLSKSSQSSSSKSAYFDLIAKSQRKKIEKKLSKVEGYTPDGFKAAIQYEWFVPELGVVAKTEVYDADGNIMAVNYINHIK